MRPFFMRCSKAIQSENNRKKESTAWWLWFPSCYGLNKKPSSTTYKTEVFCSGKIKWDDYESTLLYLINVLGRIREKKPRSKFCKYFWPVTSQNYFDWFDSWPSVRSKNKNQESSQLIQIGNFQWVFFSKFVNCTGTFIWYIRVGHGSLLDAQKRLFRAEIFSKVFFLIHNVCLPIENFPSLTKNLEKRSVKGIWGGLEKDQNCLPSGMAEKLSWGVYQQQIP